MEIDDNGRHLLYGLELDNIEVDLPNLTIVPDDHDLVSEGDEMQEDLLYRSAIELVSATPAKKARKRSNKGQSGTSARKLQPTLLPLVILALHPRRTFNSVSVYLCPSSFYSHLHDLAIKMPVKQGPLGSASVTAKDGRPYKDHSSTTTTFTPPTHPLASRRTGLGCFLLQRPTSPALFTSPTPCQRELVSPHRLAPPLLHHKS